jgi:hypothetical protein
MLRSHFASLKMHRTHAHRKLLPKWVPHTHRNLLPLIAPPQVAKLKIVFRNVTLFQRSFAYLLVMYKTISTKCHMLPTLNGAVFSTNQRFATQPHIFGKYHAKMKIEGTFWI